MCGIAGYISARDPSTSAVIDAQLAQLGHRGPDAAGSFATGFGAIGQNRLAVIDLETGDPPIVNEDGSVAVAFNGEIYNYRELREELLGKGHELSTKGDTEVLVHLAEDLEPVDLARILDGMFAFALWDGRRRRLVLGRDKLGKKPLYFWHGQGTFAFASEIKAVIAHPDVPRRLNPDALSAYLAFGYVPTPDTFFEGISSVPPGSVITIEPGSSPVITTYWEPTVPGSDRVGQLDVSFEEAASQARAVLRTAVSKRLVSDVSLGAFLSGGTDSSAVVGLMTEVSQLPVKTFTIGFEDVEGFDERPHAQEIARRFGTEHTEFVVRPDALDLIERLVWHHDQPFGDSSAIPTFLLAQLTRKHVTVALSGDGGDELFAGYERFSAALAVDRYRGLPRVVRRAIDYGLRLLPGRALGGRIASLQRFVRSADPGLPEAYLSWLAYVDEDRLRDLSPGGSDWAQDQYRDIWARSYGADLLDRLLDLNIRTYLLDDLLVKMDRMSMAHALEVRSPFLDKDLLDFAFRLPSTHKAKGWSRKRVLKAAIADLVPKEILRRRKRGFGVPLDRWFRHDLASYVDATLGSASARVREHVRGDALDSLIGEHRSGAANHGHALWALLTLEVFLRKEGW
ncbi:MAG: asparagine synthase (glutamine-hydrolyzing) [Actinomycetota bacterium]